MFLEKLNIENYKRVQNLYLEFKKVDPIDNLRTSIIIGENGTAKTTIFEYIIKNFNKLIENGDINFEGSQKNYWGSIKLIVSSYAAIDKLNLMTLSNKNENSNYSVELIKTSKVVGNLSSLINRIIELMYFKQIDGKGDILNYLLDYIGYKTYRIYLIHTKSKFKSIPALIRKSALNSHRINEEWLEYPQANVDKLTFIQEELNYFYGKINGFDKPKKNIDINIEPYIKQLKTDGIDETIGINFLNIVMKHKILFDLTSRIDSKIEFNELIREIYLGGEEQFFKDQFILNSLEIDFWKDLAFEVPGNKELISLSQLSSGELSIFIRLFDIAYYTDDNTILLIDEPETHLHPKWIKNYLPTLNDIIGDKKAHVIIATHSPLIVSDTINESIILLKRENDRIKYDYVNRATLGSSYNEVVEKIFGVEDIRESILRKYEEKIVEYISETRIEEALNLYLKIADDNLKMKLYSKLKENITYVEE